MPGMLIFMCRDSAYLCYVIINYHTTYVYLPLSMLTVLLHRGHNPHSIIHRGHNSCWGIKCLSCNLVKTSWCINKLYWSVSSCCILNITVPRLSASLWYFDYYFNEVIPYVGLTSISGHLNFGLYYSDKLCLLLRWIIIGCFKVFWTIYFL